MKCPKIVYCAFSDLNIIDSHLPLIGKCLPAASLPGTYFNWMFVCNDPHCLPPAQTSVTVVQRGVGSDDGGSLGGSNMPVDVVLGVGSLKEGVVRDDESHRNGDQKENGESLINKIVIELISYIKKKDD